MLQKLIGPEVPVQQIRGATSVCIFQPIIDPPTPSRKPFQSAVGLEGLKKRDIQSGNFLF